MAKQTQKSKQKSKVKPASKSKSKSSRRPAQAERPLSEQDRQDVIKMYEREKALASVERRRDEHMYVATRLLAGLMPALADPHDENKAVTRGERTAAAKECARLARELIIEVDIYADEEARAISAIYAIAEDDEKPAPVTAPVPTSKPEPKTLIEVFEKEEKALTKALSDAVPKPAYSTAAGVVPAPVDCDYDDEPSDEELSENDGMLDDGEDDGVVL